jgi:hypothetical protein
MIPMNFLLDRFPPTVEKAVDRLVADMTFADRTRIANMSEAALIRFHRSYGNFLRTELRLPGNDPLMRSCMLTAAVVTITAADASYVILRALHDRLLTGNILKIVK